MTEAEQIADLIKANLPHLKSGTLRFWGVWFGRPYDNLHHVVGCEANQDGLRLHFNEGETLDLWVPQKCTANNRTFKIADAERVRWEWFYYGRPKIAANRYFMDFAKTGVGVNASTNVDWYSPTSSPSREEPAVEIL